jgi:valyl-tRNA synthetase
MNLPKGYEPSAVEEKWYAQWIARGDFTADPARAFNGNNLTEGQKEKLRQQGLKEAYSIVIPPPNVTGVLTMGHVLNNTIQDILARRKRMQGFEVLWLPGIDHAGIATQNVVERELRKEKLTRHDLGREEFLKKVWSWKDKHGGIILQQLKKLGCSCDWSRTVFTMDGLDARDPTPRINYSKWVEHVFIELHKKGLIYRGRRMVNWCVISRTALSDEEVTMKEVKGHLWHIRYPLVEGSESITVATTRPETMLGDTAVAVNPEDERYKHLIGKKLKLPLVGREIPIIADILVDPKFGTGCVKVTPAHDPADFEMGVRHNLEQIQVIGFNGKMTAKAGPDFENLDRYECREKVVADLQTLGLMEKIEDYTHKVGYSERADVPSEPMLSEQWFLRYPSVDAAQKAVETGDIKFWPDRWAKVYEHWLTNIKDWCISRQLWWGHRIPAWLRKGADGETEVHVGTAAPQGEGWEQDPDVLDTWFSSWLWPFATMVPDPDQQEAERNNPNSDLAKFYPTHDLVTGPDIIFFWVARMIMAGFEFENKKPFSNVYYTGMVRDKQGRKMSKSLGNSPDPLVLIEKFGADGLRFGMMRCAPLGLDIRFEESQVEQGRHFCNKLFNAARLRLSQQSDQKFNLQELTAADLTSDDKAILLRLNETIENLNKHFDGYEFNQITAKLYDFFWGQYCDWYLESSKASLYSENPRAKAVTLAVMDHVLHNLLRLLHPVMPFITEDLWHGCGFSSETIQFTPWPSPLKTADCERLGLHQGVLEFVRTKEEAVSAVRNLRASYNIPTHKKVRVLISPTGSWYKEASERAILQSLLNAESTEIIQEAPANSASCVTPLGTFHVPLEGLVDPEAEAKRLSNQIAKLQKELQQVESKLADEGFTSRAPAAAVEKHRSRAAELRSDIEKIQSQISALK